MTMNSQPQEEKSSSFKSEPRKILVELEVAGEPQGGEIPVYTGTVNGNQNECVAMVSELAVVQDISQRIELSWDENTKLFVVPKVALPPGQAEKLAVGIKRLLDGDSRCILFEFPVNIYALRKET
jgi:hypothetical protein